MRCYDKSTKLPSKSSIWISVWRPIHMKFQQPLDDHPSPILLNNQHNDSSVRHISYPKLSMMSTAWNPNVLHLDITYSMTLKSYLIKPSFPLDKNFELSMENEYSTIFSHFRSIFLENALNSFMTWIFEAFHLSERTLWKSIVCREWSWFYRNSIITFSKTQKLKYFRNIFSNQISPWHCYSQRQNFSAQLKVGREHI